MGGAGTSHGENGRCKIRGRVKDLSSLHFTGFVGRKICPLLCLKIEAPVLCPGEATNFLRNIV